MKVVGDIVGSLKIIMNRSSAKRPGNSGSSSSSPSYPGKTKRARTFNGENDLIALGGYEKTTQVLARAAALNSSRGAAQPATHRVGAICSINLTNFMTHQQFSWRPEPLVNILTGPNGAGKSSILQAIVLGLGKYFLYFAKCAPSCMR